MKTLTRNGREFLGELDGYEIGIRPTEIDGTEYRRITITPLDVPGAQPRCTLNVSAKFISTDGAINIAKNKVGQFNRARK